MQGSSDLNQKLNPAWSAQWQTRLLALPGVVTLLWLLGLLLSHTPAPEALQWRAKLDTSSALALRPAPQPQPHPPEFAPPRPLIWSEWLKLPSVTLVPPRPERLFLPRPLALLCRWQTEGG